MAASLIPPRPAPPRRRHPWEVQRAVLFALLLREMKARVGGQWVGAVWTLFEPLAHTALLVMVLGAMSGQTMPGIEYPVFLVTGLVPFFLFQNMATRLMDGIESNRGLFAYRQVKPLDPLLARALVELMMNLAGYAVTLGVLAWLGYHVVPHQPLEMIGVNLLLAFFGTAFGIFTAVLSHGRARLRSLIRMALMPLYFASGVIFHVDLLPREYIDWLLWNPVLHLVELSRHAFIESYVPTDGINGLYPLLFALTLAALGLALYRAKRLQLVAS
jgi:capsular polysaccharide transport system permease protein